jgi:homocysteine S-methyltransferase
VTNPFEPFFRQQGAVVLDGGLATTLESYGFDLNDSLWSARVLLQAPEAVRRAHLEFLAAGADCIATATYQATHAGLAARGLDDGEVEEVLRRAVSLAVEARDEFWSEPANRGQRLRPLVAASIGPYGAYLADGSEYTGDYGLSEDALYDFHAPRWRLLAESDVDLMACETIPSTPEVHALLRLLAESDDRWGWMSFSCRDGAHLADGTPVTDAAGACRAGSRVAAVGVNCVAPGLASELLAHLAHDEGPPVVVYPNSGERYDAVSKTWSAGESGEGLGSAIPRWMDEGARVLGGCCRVLPEEIRAIRQAALS